MNCWIFITGIFIPFSASMYDYFFLEVIPFIWILKDVNISIGVSESTQIEDASQSGQDKLYPKSKSKHKRRRYG